MKALTICILLLPFSTLFGQTDSNRTKNAFALIDSTIQSGDYVFEIYNIEYPKDVQEILMKIKKAITDNSVYFQDYFNKNYKEGEGLPYTEKFGVTKEDYQKIKDLTKNPPKMKPLFFKKVRVKKEEGRLSFHTLDDFKIIEEIKIDLKSMLLIFANDTISYSNEINTSPSGGLGQWHGYSWKMEETNQPGDIKLDDLTAKIVEINFGKTLQENKVVIRIKYKEVVKGMKKAEYDIIGFLKTTVSAGK